MKASRKARAPICSGEVWKSQIIAQNARRAWWESRVPGLPALPWGWGSSGHGAAHQEGEAEFEHLENCSEDDSEGSFQPGSRLIE